MIFFPRLQKFQLLTPSLGTFLVCVKPQATTASSCVEHLAAAGSAPGRGAHAHTQVLVISPGLP